MEPQRLAAGQGWQWIKQGYALFMKAPLLWVVLLLICFFAVAGLSAVPVVGEPLTSLLLPVVLVGLMTGCRALEHGEELELAHLFSGFRQRTAQLVTLGGIALVGQFLIFGVTMMLGWLVLMPLVFTSLYACYCDIFPTAKEGAQPSAKSDVFTPDKGVF